MALLEADGRSACTRFDRNLLKIFIILLKYTPSLISAKTGIFGRWRRKLVGSDGATCLRPGSVKLRRDFLHFLGLRC